ncbi:MAG: dihydrofolate reductase family protein, partial [Proteobacteria bacterium]|nr:dihydrofolate reductase family protein [Pseudomonadota bacterium]
REAGAHVFRVGGGAGGLDPRAVLHAIADRGITRLMIEGGPHIATTFLAADLVDECVVMRAPMRIGEAGIDALVAMRPGVASRLDDFLCAPRMRRRATCVLGEDQVEIFERM